MEIYTDGACSNNPGIGSSAYIVVEDGKVIFQECNIIEKSTNNIAELSAVINALIFLYSENKNGTILSDSIYVVCGINLWMWKWEKNNWKGYNGKVIENLSQWKMLYDLVNKIKSKDLSITVKHIKGHSTNEWNNLADKLAKKTIKSYKNAHTEK